MELDDKSAYVERHSAVDVALIETDEEFLALEREWHSLYQRDPSANIFLSHRWLRDLFQRRPGVCILACFATTSSKKHKETKRELVAVLPLRPTISVDLKRVRFRQDMFLAGNHWADRTGALCRAEFELDALPAMANALIELPWERLYLGNLPAEPHRYDTFLKTFRSDDFSIREWRPTDNNGETRLDLAPRLLLPASFETWLREQLGSNTRQKIRRFRRKYSTSPDFTIRDATLETKNRDLDTFEQMWLHRWKRIKGRSTRIKAEKYRRIIDDGITSGHMRLTVFEYKRQAVAIHALYDDSVTKTVSYFVGARDGSFTALPAGLLLHADAIERAIAQGRKCYDFLRGDEPYKYQLGAIDAALTSIEFRRTPPRIDDVFLQYRYRDMAIEMIENLHESASRDSLNSLYSQLLESWPGDSLLVDHYFRWQRHQPEDQATPRL